MAKTQRVEEGDMVVTRDECRAMIAAALAAYDRNARRRFGWWATTLTPLRWAGALARDGVSTAIGFTVYCWRRVKGQSHEEALS